MAGRTPQEARALGLWTASWLFVLLLIGLLWLGDLALQWPVLLVPVLWALVALRPRRRARRVAHEDDDVPSYWDQPDHWDDGENAHRPASPERTDTVEAPWVREQRRRPPG